MPSDSVTLGNGSSPLDELAVDVVRLDQHVAGRRHHVLGFGRERVRRRAQDVVEIEIEAPREFGRLLFECVDLLRPDGDHLRRHPRRLFAEPRLERLAELHALLILRDAHILVALERGIDVEPRDFLARMADRVERREHRGRALAQRALVFVEGIDFGLRAWPARRSTPRARDRDRSNPTYRRDWRRRRPAHPRRGRSWKSSSVRTLRSGSISCWVPPHACLPVRRRARQPAMSL